MVVSLMLAVLVCVVYGYKLPLYATFSDALVNIVGTMIGVRIDGGVLPSELWLVRAGGGISLGWQLESPLPS